MKARRDQMTLDLFFDDQVPAPAPDADGAFALRGCLAAVMSKAIADSGKSRADIAAVDQPWGLTTNAPFAITVETIRLASNEGDAVCPN